MSPITAYGSSLGDLTTHSGARDETSMVKSDAASEPPQTSSLLSGISTAWESFMTAYPMRLRSYENTLQAVLLKATHQKFPGDGTVSMFLRS
jgi:hypothetical protein